MLGPPLSVRETSFALQHRHSGNHLLDFIFIIVATVKAKNGEPYRYPFTIRLIG